MQLQIFQYHQMLHTWLLLQVPDGLIVGSASFASEDLQGGQQSLAVWGDDTGTPELDGLLAGEEILFNC